MKPYRERLEGPLRVERKGLEKRRENDWYRGYVIDRDCLKHPFKQISGNLGKNAKILEIGISAGKALDAILSENPHIQARNCFGTSLEYLPEHAAIESLGINIVTGILADDLPVNWKNKFDVTMACAVVMWTSNPERACELLLDVTKIQGYVLVYDHWQNINMLQNIAKEQRAKVFKPKPEMVEELSGTIIQKV